MPEHDYVQALKKQNKMIRTYQDTDIESVLDIYYKASILATPFLDKDFLEQEKKNIRDLYIPNTKTWVYEDDGKVIGFIGMLGNEVGAIFIYPSHHGKGIGTKLMDHVATMYDHLEVEVFEENKIGRKFYDKYGCRWIRYLPYGRE